MNARESKTRVHPRNGEGSVHRRPTGIVAGLTIYGILHIRHSFCYTCLSAKKSNMPAKDIFHDDTLIDILDGKVWIQRDGTEYGIARELEKAGIPKHHIVLGFHTPDVRPFTEYAVA